MSDTESMDSSGFADPTRAMRMRDAIRRIAEQEVGRLTATQQTGRVVSANFATMTAQVWIPGDPEPITVNMFEDLIPGVLGEQGYRSYTEISSTTGPGSLVIIDKVGGKLYITRVLSGSQFSHNLGAAGLVHKSFISLPHGQDTVDIWSNTPPVQGNYGLQVSFHAPSNGMGVMVGPFVGTSDGTFYPGHIKIHVSRYEDTAMFEVNLRDEAIWKFTGSAGDTRWMRMIPKMRGSWYEEMSLCVDIGLRATFMRDKQGYNEIWLRFSDPIHGADFIYATVEAYGPLVVYGDVDLNRLRCEDTDDISYSGFLGFHNSQFLFRAKEDEAGKTGPFVPTAGSYGGDIEDSPPHWFSGPWDSGAIRTAQDIRHIWGCDGAFTWNGSALTWSGNLEFGGVGPNLYGLPYSTLQVPVPASGITFPVIPNSTYISPYPYVASVTTTSAGIPIPAGCTLYYGLPPGMSTTPGDGLTNWHNKSWMFFLVNNNLNVPDLGTNYDHPAWAIPIAHRSINTNALNDFRVLGIGNELVDTTRFQVAQANSSTGNLAIDTEHVVQTITSFNFKAGAAYLVRAKTGWIINNPASVTTTAANNTVINFRLRKGTTSGGTDIGEFFRVPVTQGLGSVHHFYGEMYLTPAAGGSGSFVLTAALDWVNGANPATTPTMLMYGGVSKRWLDIEYAGPASRFPQAITY